MKICLLNWKEIRRDLVAEIRSFVRRPLVCERRWLKPFYSCYHPLRDSSTFLQIHFESDLNPPEVLRHCACVVKTIFQKSTDVWKFNLRCEKILQWKTLGLFSQRFKIHASFETKWRELFTQSLWLLHSEELLEIYNKDAPTERNFRLRERWDQNQPSPTEEQGHGRWKTLEWVCKRCFLHREMKHVSHSLQLKIKLYLTEAAGVTLQFK